MKLSRRVFPRFSTALLKSLKRQIGIMLEDSVLGMGGMFHVKHNWSFPDLGGCSRVCVRAWGDFSTGHEVSGSHVPWEGIGEVLEVLSA